MNIELKNIAPDPLIGAFLSEGELWQKDLLFKAGELIHVLAPSGSGKSTLMGLLYGTRKDYRGDLLFDEVNAEKCDWSVKRTNELAIVFQDLELLNDLSVLENIQLKNQLTNHFSDQEIHDMLLLLGVEHLTNKKVGLISRGEKQRVAIIRSLCMPFKWLLLDEPFSALDEENTLKAIRLIKTQVEKNKAGIVLANLFKDNCFDYTQSIKMA